MRFRTPLSAEVPGSGNRTRDVTLGANPRFHHCADGDMFRNQTRDLKRTPPAIGYYGSKIVCKLNADQTPAKALTGMVYPTFTL